MSKIFSKGEIDRLGGRIRSEMGNLNEDTLNELQLYRTSHNEAISNIFNILCTISKRVDSTAIVTFRIKRIQSILSKLDRFPEMRFSRMWDIAGCRCILQQTEDVFKIKKLLRKDPNIEIIKETDYITNPKEDGYRSLHLFVKHTCSDVVIEIQLRNLINHNWATLVEISDLLFDSKLKEYGNNKELLRFHFLLSNIDTLTIKEKYEIASTIRKYNYWHSLSEVFSRNYLIVRKRWMELKSNYNHRYFLIETAKGEIPIIESFSNFHDAEESYFTIYLSRPNANIVLTHMQKPSYNQISIAYSNYILTSHAFLAESLLLLESLIVEAIKRNKYLLFYKNLKLHQDLVFTNTKDLMEEISDAEIHVEGILTNSAKRKNKENEWITDIKKQINSSNKNMQRVNNTISKNIPQSGLPKFIFRLLIRKVNRIHNKRAKKAHLIN